MATLRRTKKLEMAELVAGAVGLCEEEWGQEPLEFPTESLAFAQCACPCLRHVFRRSSVQSDDLCQPFCVQLLEAARQRLSPHHSRRS